MLKCLEHVRTHTFSFTITNVIKSSTSHPTPPSPARPPYSTSVIHTVRSPLLFSSLRGMGKTHPTYCTRFIGYGGRRYGALSGEASMPPYPPFPTPQSTLSFHAVCRTYDTRGRATMLCKTPVLLPYR
ncbi:hypothetical protein BaRGS_00029221 [Batillaria attramentaria]|uniref:Uncharacterized protein n=1 Tax=Batillaria attramentaria TaxID=370345 RepID=A0ABD0JXR2_9CAEN